MVEISLFGVHMGLMAGNGFPGDQLTCIPVVAAASPRKINGETAEEVEESPGQDNDVVYVEENDDDLGGVADAWGEKVQRGAGGHAQLSHS